MNIIIQYLLTFTRPFINSTNLIDISEIIKEMKVKCNVSNEFYMLDTVNRIKLYLIHIA